MLGYLAKHSFVDWGCDASEQVETEHLFCKGKWTSYVRLEKSLIELYIIGFCNLST